MLSRQQTDPSIPTCHHFQDTNTRYRHVLPCFKPLFKCLLREVRSVSCWELLWTQRSCWWAPLWMSKALLSSSQRHLQCWKSPGCSSALSAFILAGYLISWKLQLESRNWEDSHWDAVCWGEHFQWTFCTWRRWRPATACSESVESKIEILLIVAAWKDLLGTTYSWSSRKDAQVEASLVIKYD